MYNWDNLSEQNLLNLSFKELKLELGSGRVPELILEVLSELEFKGVTFTPHFWFGDDWFVAENHTGVSIPFFLANSRLTQLEKKMVGFAEGSGEQRFKKLLRHEIGHAIDHAYKLYLDKNRSALFGHSSDNYPSKYDFKKYSKAYVRNLEEGYAQSHPAEDFAETFAVWVNPDSDWKNKYKRWPAIKKLEFMDQMMKTLSGKRAKVISKSEIDPICNMKTTLREYYSRKSRIYNKSKDSYWDDSIDELQLGHSSEVCIKKNLDGLSSHISRRAGVPVFKVKWIMSSFQKRLAKISVNNGTNTVSMRQIEQYFTKNIQKYVADGKHLIKM